MLKDQWIEDIRRDYEKKLHLPSVKQCKARVYSEHNNDLRLSQETQSYRILVS